MSSAYCEYLLHIMDVKGKERGILKLEPRPKVVVDTSRWELMPQVSYEHPSSPQPSVDRLSVTWADPGSMASSGVNLFHLPSETPISNEVKFTSGTQDGSEDEDYSASLSAVLRHRRASVRRSRKGRARRPSSPFLQDENRSRRRSSIFTTSSGDTAISMEEAPAVVTQEQIFENIHLHKEVLGSVKQQPLGMRRKLKIVHQAKGYIKRHEGQLQERLAQSKRTRDIYARFNILMASKWQQLKREAANTSNLLIPWELRIKEIESHFGSVVASYFTFLRWLFWVNLVIGFILLVFVIVPEYLTADPQHDGERKVIMEEEKMNATKLLTLWEFEGILKCSPIFYGYYSNIERPQYRMPLAYFLTGLVVYIYSFVAILRKMAENSRMSKLSEKEDECIFSWKLFTGWDYMIGNAETAHNRIASVILGFKEALLEEAEKKKDLRNWRIISLRALVNICVVILLAVSAYAVVYVVSRSDDNPKVRSWWRENETTTVVTVISITFPLFFELLGFLEHHHPRKQLRLQLARIMLLNLLNLYSLIFALFSKIEGMSKDLDQLKPTLSMNATMPSSALNISESIIFKQPTVCKERRIPCGLCTKNLKFLNKEDLQKSTKVFHINEPKPIQMEVHGNYDSETKYLPKTNLESANLEKYIDKSDITTINSILVGFEQLNFLRNYHNFTDTYPEPTDSQADNIDYFDNNVNSSYDNIFEYNDNTTSGTSKTTEFGNQSKTTIYEQDINYTYDTSTASVTYSTDYQSTDTHDSSKFSTINTDSTESSSYFEDTSQTAETLDIFGSTNTISTFDYDITQTTDSTTDASSDYPVQDNLDSTTSTTYDEDNQIINIQFTSTTDTNDYATSIIEESTTMKVYTENTDNVPITLNTDLSTAKPVEVINTCLDFSFNCSVECGNRNITQVFFISNCNTVDTVCYETKCDVYISSSNMTANQTNTTYDIVYNDEHNIKQYNLTVATKKKLLKLCWETMFGQELVKLTMMDLVFVLLGTLFMDFFRALFVRYMNRCWCWDLEKKFPEYGDFKIAENILHLINNQGMVWMGMFFSPGLVVLNVVKLMIMMYLRSWAVMTCNVPHEVVFRVSKSNNFYLALLLTMLFLCVLPVGYTIVWVKPSWHCGPFSEYDKIYYILTNNIYKIFPLSLNFILKYIASPAFVIPLLVLLILIIYYLTSLTNSLREANNDLKIQLRRERTEERRKMFQLADTRRRAGSSAMDNTPFARWKKALPSLPISKSIDSDDRKTNTNDETSEPFKVKKRGGIFAKIVNMALDKKSDVSISEATSQFPYNMDDENDTDFHEKLPKEILKAKDITIENVTQKKKNNVEFKTSTTVKNQSPSLIQNQEDDVNDKKIISDKQLKDKFQLYLAKSKSKIAEEPRPPPNENKKINEKQTSESSTQSKQSDSIGSVIPVIMISTTESDEEGLKADTSKKDIKTKEKKHKDYVKLSRSTGTGEKKVKKPTSDQKSLRRQSSVDSIKDQNSPKEIKPDEGGHKYQYSL